VGVYHRGARVVAHSFRGFTRLEPPLSNSTEVFSKPNCTVRVMTKEVGFDEVINDNSGVSGLTPSDFKKLVTDLTKRLRWECGHNRKLTVLFP
jgi:hypothetical protein